MASKAELKATILYNVFGKIDETISAASKLNRFIAQNAYALKVKPVQLIKEAVEHAIVATPLADHFIDKAENVVEDDDEADFLDVLDTICESFTADIGVVLADHAESSDDLNAAVEEIRNTLATITAERIKEIGLESFMDDEEGEETEVSASVPN